MNWTQKIVLILSLSLVFVVLLIATVTDALIWALKIFPKRQRRHALAMTSVHENPLVNSSQQRKTVA